MRLARWAAAGAAFALCGAAVVGAGGSPAQAEGTPDDPPPIVEDYAYPGADAILAQHGLKLIRGDGHILFETSHLYGAGQCAVGQIQVERMLDAAPYGVYFCFTTNGTSGFLTLEVPATFGIRGGTVPVVAKAELPTGEKSYSVGANSYVAISPGSGSSAPSAILVELRFSSGS